VSASASAEPSASARAFVPVRYDLEENPKFQVGARLRPLDRQIFEQLMNPDLTRERMDDLFPTLPFRVRVGGSAAEHRYGLVLIDLNRDGKWDERWVLDGQEVTRIAFTDPATGGRETMYNLRGARWQVH
jgi:hypothetical protein